MSAVELDGLEEILGVAARGRLLGALTTRELAGAIVELELDEADLAELRAALDAGEALAPLEDPGPPVLADRRPAGDPTGPNGPLDLDADITIDSLQVFLRDVGRIPLLTRTRRAPARAADRAG